MKPAFVLLASVLSVVAQDLPTFVWSPTGRLVEARSSACVAPLQDGRGLVAGGEGAAGTLSSVEIYGLDGQFTPGPPMNFARSQHTCTTLNDGRVLVVGGGAPAEIYDPGANAWSVLDTPGLGRRASTATLRPDGSVVIAGGSVDDQVSAAIEIFDPGTNLISILDALLASPRKNHAAALLPDGSILIAGGTNGSDVLATTEIIGLDGSIVAGPTMPEPRTYLSATPLPDGRVLIAGGNDGQVDLVTNYLFTPWDSTLLYTSQLKTGRSRHVAIAIPGNGSILIAGGDSFGTPTASSEIFDLATETFQPVGNLTVARREIAAAALSQPGVVLSVGGLSDSGPLNACGVFLAPAISFDKRIYAAGDTFHISGAHWKPGGVTARVTLVNLLQASSGNFLGEVTADATGSLQYTAPTPLTSASVGSNIQATFVASDGTSATAAALQNDPTTTTVSLSPTPATAGQAVTITANVRELLGVVSTLPGVVNFTLDGATLGSSSSQSFDAAANHLFTFTAPGFKGGAHVIQAAYASGSGMFPASSSSAQLQVNKMGTTLSLGATHMVAIGDTIQVTITVKPVTTVSLPAPTGTVQLLVNGVTHNLALTPNNLAMASSAAFSFQAAGPPQTISYQASYQGDDNYNAVGGASNSTIVTRPKATITMTPQKTLLVLGDEVVFNIRIQPQAGGVAPTGTIQALQSLVQTSLPLAPADSTGTSTTPVDFGLLGVGSWTLFVHYSGDSAYDPSDAQYSFQISKATPKLVMYVQNVTTLNTTFYKAGIQVSDPHYMFESRFPGGTISVFYNGSSTAAHTFALQTGNVLPILDFSYSGQDPIFALIGTTFPIKFVYSGDSNYNSVQATCNAKVDLFADATHISCNTYP